MIFFSDIFKVPAKTLKIYGAFDISLINDLPLFIDPFLLFNSNKRDYKALHKAIIDYVRFLKNMSEQGEISHGNIKSWFLFPEVKQNWFGYSKVGNQGSGLGQKFAEALHKNMYTIFQNFGAEEITKSSHLEKLCLIRDGVGKDHISDFTTNLIKGFLLEYTQKFAINHLKPNVLLKHMVSHVSFNYQTRAWTHKEYLLPTFKGDYILLTPRDILTKDETWINKPDMIDRFRGIAHSIPNVQLRDQINQYFVRSLPVNHNKKDFNYAVIATINKYPQLIDYYIKDKEDHGNEAKAHSSKKVAETEAFFVKNIKRLIELLSKETSFYETPSDSLEEAYKKVLYLKHVIEDQDGYRLFYLADGTPIQRESDLHIAYRLTWSNTKFDVNSEVNNGMGPVDFKISYGNKDTSLVEFKLAKNTQLKSNLKKQVEVYKKANQTAKSIKVILYFTDYELHKVNNILKKLSLEVGKEIVLIDCRNTNKISASKRR